MVRMVQPEDLLRHPELNRMGVSANQYFDFQFIEPKQNSYPNNDYDITEYTPIDYGNFLPKHKETKKWSKSVDKIFVINLAKRKDRMLNAVQQLNKYAIPFERVEAIEHEKGAEGLVLTMIKLFKDCIKKKYQNVCVFEDDLDIIEPGINQIMSRVMNNLPENYDIIYLGCQLCSVPKLTESRDLLKVNHAYSTHAAIYSLKAMKDIIKGKPEAPYDNFVVRHVQQKENCYCTFPMLVSQIVSHSDIYSDSELMDWTSHLQKKFSDMVNQIRR